MFNRLRTELEEVFLEYNISLDMNFFTEEILALAGITNIKKLNLQQYGFTSYGNLNAADTEILRFSPPPLTLEEFELLLKFFKVPRDQVKIGKSLPINVNVIFNEILGQFKDHMRKMAAEKSEKIREIIIASKHVLEEKTTRKLQGATTALYKALAAVESANPTYKALKEIILHAIGAIAMLRDLSENFHDTLDVAKKLNDFYVIAHAEFEQDEKITSLLDDVFLAFAEYGKFNRAEAKLAAKKFSNEIESFVNQYQISTHSCDIVEETILKLASISTQPLKCEYAPNEYGDQTRFYLKIIGIRQEDAQQLQQYFKSLGDESASLSPEFEVDKGTINKEDDGMRPQRAYAGTVGTFAPAGLKPESLSCATPSIGKKKKQIEMVKGFTLEVAGETLYQLVYPQVKAQISAWAAEAGSNLLKTYQIKSAYFLATREIANLRVLASELRIALDKKLLTQLISPAEQAKLEKTLQSLIDMKEDIHSAEDFEENTHYAQNLSDALRAFDDQIEALPILPNQFFQDARKLSEGVAKYLKTLSPAAAPNLSKLKELSVFSQKNDKPVVVSESHEVTLSLRRVNG